MRVRETRWGWKATTSRPVADDRPGGLEVTGDLDVVVRVRVVDADPGGLALELHPATGAGEGGQPGGEVGEGEAEAQPHREGGGRVEDVVPTGDAQPQLAQVDAVADDAADRRGAVEGEVDDPQVAVVGLPHGDHLEAGRAGGRRERAGPRVVGAADQEAVAVDRVGELVEGRVVGLLGAPVVEVVGLDVGDDRGVRAVDEEGAVGLVGLGDEQVVGARVGVAAGGGEHSPDGVRRIRRPPPAGRWSAGRSWWSCRGCRRRRGRGCRPWWRRARPSGAAPADRADGPRRPRRCPRVRPW